MYNINPAGATDAKRYRNLVRWFMARDATFIEQAMDQLGLCEDARPTLEEFDASMDLAAELEAKHVEAQTPRA